jgi:hypothetical protein
VGLGYQNLSVLTVGRKATSIIFLELEEEVVRDVTAPNTRVNQRKMVSKPLTMAYCFA